MGPSKAFRPIAPNGNSTDGRQTFFTSALCIGMALGALSFQGGRIGISGDTRLPAL
jgi:hypothetical protein